MISLVHHIDTVAVAQFVNVFAIGIVRGAQEVDVALLHQRDVLLIGGIVDISARHRMVVVTVHATQLAVKLKHLADNINFPHAKVIVEVLNDGSFIID